MAARQVLVKIRKRFDGDDLQVRDQRGFGRIYLGHEHPLESIGARCGRHRQHSACVTDKPIEGKLSARRGSLTPLSYDQRTPHS